MVPCAEVRVVVAVVAAEKPAVKSAYEGSIKAKQDMGISEINVYGQR